MQSRNPVLNRIGHEQASGAPGFAYDEGRSAYTQAGAAGTQPGAYPPPGYPQQGYPQQGYPQQGYPPPGYAPAPAQGLRLTMNDVVVKTAICFAFVLAGAVVGWTTAVSVPFLWIGAALVGFVLALVNTFRRQVSPALVLAYAAVQGVFLGGISYWYDQLALASNYQGLVLQAVIATFTAFAVMLALYTTRIIRVNGTFMRIMMVAMVSYFLIAMASLVAALFGAGGGWGFYGMGTIGILLCVFGVALAAFSLAMDFEAVKQSVRAGLPERESWRLAFGLLVTLIWLYLEILRLLAIIATSRD